MSLVVGKVPGASTVGRSITISGTGFSIAVRRIFETNRFTPIGPYTTSFTSLSELTPALIASFKKTAVLTSIKNQFPLLSTAILTWSTGSVTYQMSTPAALNQAGSVIASGFPAGAGAGGTNTGRFFGDARNPKNFGIFTPDGRRLGN